MKRKEPTWTALVLAVLKKQDDFLNFRMLMDATGANANQVSAACHHLRKRHAISAIIEPDGVAWWYATPETDDRMRAVAERAPEQRPRKRMTKAEREAREAALRG